jgi:hypothetical protein
MQESAMEMLGFAYTAFGDCQTTTALTPQLGNAIKL